MPKLKKEAKQAFEVGAVSKKEMTEKSASFFALNPPPRHVKPL